MRELTGIDTDNRLIKIDTEISLNKFLDYTKVIIHNWPQICRHHLDLTCFLVIYNKIKEKCLWKEKHYLKQFYIKKQEADI